MQAPTPYWNQVRRDHPEAHEALEQVAAAIFEQCKESVLVSEIAELAPGPAVELGLLKIEDEEVSFSDQKVQKDYLTRCAVETVALPAWDDFQHFIDALDDIRHRGAQLKVWREIATGVLIVLARDEGKDVISRIGEAAAPETPEGRNNSFWTLYHPFCTALPNLDYEVEQLAGSLESVLRASENDGTGGMIYTAVRNLAARSRSDAEVLYDAFISRPDSRVVALAVEALLSLASFDLEEAHQRALALTQAEPAILRRVGIATLGQLQYADRDDLLRATLERLDVLKTTPSPETDYTLARAYGNLLQTTEEATDALLELAMRDDPAVMHQIATVLWHNGDQASEQQWFQEALLHLARVPTTQTGTLQRLDFCVAHCAENQPDIALSFVERFVTSRDYGHEGEDSSLPDVLTSTLSALRQHHPDALQDAVTRWFGSNEPRLHRAARDVVEQRVLDDSAPAFRLSKAVLDDLEEQAVVNILTRIMGYVGGSRALATLLVSALERDPCPPPLAEFITQALTEHVLYNYPREAGDLLRKQLDQEGISEVKSKAVQNALDRSDAYYEALDSLPQAKELRPSSHRANSLWIAQRRQNKEMMEQPSRHTPLLNLIHRVPLKYGRAFFTEQEGAFTELSHLSTISTGWEPPHGEFIDPLGQTYKRIQWRQAGLPHEDDETTESDIKGDE